MSDIVDIIISLLESEDTRILHLNWYQELTLCLSYPRMNRFGRAISSPSHLLLFYKLLQRDICLTVREEEQQYPLAIMNHYISLTLAERSLPLTLWSDVSGLDLLEFMEQYGIKAPELTALHYDKPMIDMSATSQPVPERMPCMLTEDEGLQLYHFLEDNEFITPSTSADCFLFRMGAAGASASDQRPICWQKNKQLLREMLEMCFDKLISGKAVTKADIERRVPKCFVNRSMKSILLSKNKVEESIDRDILLDYFYKNRK